MRPGLARMHLLSQCTRGRTYCIRSGGIRRLVSTLSTTISTAGHSADEDEFLARPATWTPYMCGHTRFNSVRTDSFPRRRGFVCFFINTAVYLRRPTIRDGDYQMGIAGEPMSRQACGRAGGRAGGQAGGLLSKRADDLAGDRSEERSDGRASRRERERAGERPGGRADERMPYNSNEVRNVTSSLRDPAVSGAFRRRRLTPSNMLPVRSNITSTIERC